MGRRWGDELGPLRRLSFRRPLDVEGDERICHKLRRVTRSVTPRNRALLLWIYLDRVVSHSRKIPPSLHEAITLRVSVRTHWLLRSMYALFLGLRLPSHMQFLALKWSSMPNLSSSHLLHNIFHTQIGKTFCELHSSILVSRRQV